MPPLASTVHPPPALYLASVPTCLRALERLDGLLVQAGRWAQACGLAEAELLEARLAPDMQPWAAQVMIAAHFAQRACFPLAGRPVPAWPGVAASLAGLRESLRPIRERLAALPPEAFEAAEGRTFCDRAGEAELALPAWTFLTQYALPNLCFHQSMAYAILRQRGAPVGKADFDGWHVYPPPQADPAG